MLLLLQKELISAMKAKDKATLTGLRNIIGKLKAQRINKGDDLTDQECIQILQSSVKQLKFSIEQYEKGGRDDLAKVEAFELELIEKYLPEQISEEEIRISASDKCLGKYFSMSSNSNVSTCTRSSLPPFAY